MVEEIEELLESEYLCEFDVYRRGYEESLDRVSGATYWLPDVNLKLYSVDRGLGELNHPFRPSGDIILELSSDSGSEYYAANHDDFAAIDSFLMDLIEGAGSEYYKEVRSLEGNRTL